MAKPLMVDGLFTITVQSKAAINMQTEDNRGKKVARKNFMDVLFMRLVTHLLSGLQSFPVQIVNPSPRIPKLIRTQTRICSWSPECSYNELNILPLLGREKLLLHHCK